MPSRFRESLRRTSLQDYVVYLSFVAVLLMFYTIIGDTFLSWSNLRNIAIQSAVACVSAGAMVIVISGRMIDLSIGATAALSSVIVAFTLQATSSLPLAVLAGLVLGAAVGLANGALIAFGGLPPFLVTLGMQGIVYGLAQWLTGMQSVPIYDKRFTALFGMASLGPIPILFVWACLVFVLVYYIMNQTRFGKKVLAIGANESAAGYSGIHVRSAKLRIMMLSGVFAALAGMLYAGRAQAARHGFGQDLTFTVIASVILGGTQMKGGKARVFGALVAALLLGMVDNGLIIIGFSVSEQTIFRGIVIVLATLLGTVTGRRRPQKL